MSSAQSVGQRFVQLIQHLGLSKNAFAQSLDKTATVIQHLVEERNKPGYDLLCKVFKVYPNVSKDWLMEGAGPMLKMDKPVSDAATPVVDVPVNVAVGVEPAVAAPLAATGAPVPPVAGPAPQPVAEAPLAVAPPQPVPSPAVPTAAPVAVPVAAPAPAPIAAPAPDPAYFAVALQTQYLQHQLALAEQRNQHLLEQQALMQQMMAVLQRSSV